MRIIATILSIAVLVLLSAAYLPVYAQQRHAADTGSFRTLSVITIEKSRGPADNVIDNRKAAIPLTIIDKKKLALMGSRRLDEVLREQTGMAVVSDLGAGNRATGLQMQGFSAEYITILIDGQPVTGRINGNFDLSRISLSNIERIEIIKGASSSLYGSDALGGVINIVTRQHATQTQALINVLYGTYNTTDATVETEIPFAEKRGAVFAAANYYRTDGFNVNPYLKEGTTSPPYNSLSLQGRARYRLTERTSLHLTGRYADRHSVMLRSYGSMPNKDVLDEKDLNTMLALNTNFSNGLRLIGRYYMTRYASKQDVTLLQNDGILQRNHFSEYIHRGEIQAAKDLFEKKLSIIGGAGTDYQATLATAKGTGGNMINYFGYTQANWNPSSTLHITGGLRYDGNSLYGGRLNPGIGVNYTPASWITLKASARKGYRSPTYRQLYQVFTNMMQGYTVVGANVFPEAIADLRISGEVQQVWPIAASISDLHPETSTSWNAGLVLNPVKNTEISINGFYNNIYNLINSQQAGIKTNGAQLFSWFNIARTYTKGLEVELRWQSLPGFTLSGGYQLLYAKDRSVIDSIRAETGAYAKVRTPSAIRTATASDYFSLPNRSRHMANLQLFYEYKPWGLNVSVRGSYRSKYGFLDQDNNGYIDRYDVFVNGYALLNASIQKQLLRKRLTMQVTIDNINNYTDMLMPAQPGRMLLAGLTWKCFKQQQHEK